MEYTVLKIDLDMAFDLFMSKFKIFWETNRRNWLLDIHKLDNLIFEYKESTSGFTHVYIKIPRKIGADDMNYLQFLCGDHAYRVMLNQKRIDAGIKHWNKFFVKKRKIKHGSVNNDG